MRNYITVVVEVKDDEVDVTDFVAVTEFLEKHSLDMYGFSGGVFYVNSRREAE